MLDGGHPGQGRISLISGQRPIQLGPELTHSPCFAPAVPSAPRSPRSSSRTRFRLARALCGRCARIAGVSRRCRARRMVGLSTQRTWPNGLRPSGLPLWEAIVLTRLSSSARTLQILTLASSGSSCTSLSTPRDPFRPSISIQPCSSHPRLRPRPILLILPQSPFVSGIPRTSS
jgi:hypothetical protein